MTTEDKIEALLEGATGWTEAEFRALAMAALDQGGLSNKTQRKISELVHVCVDCKLEPAVESRRCEPCADLYHSSRLELARDMELDRRIDEARGK